MMKYGAKIQDTTNTFRHTSKLFSVKNHQSLILIQTDTPCYCGEKLFQKTIYKIGITWNSPAFNHITERIIMNNRKYRSRYCLRKIILGLLIVVTIPLTIAGCRNKEMSPRRATEFATDRLGLSDEQSQKIAPIAEDLFAEKESLQEI